MWLLVVLHAAGLVVHPAGMHPVFYSWPGLPAMGMAVWVCWRAAERTGRRRWEVVLPAAAVAAQAAGITYVAVARLAGAPAPLPSPGDAGFLAFNVLLLAGLIVSVRNGPTGLALPVWLDCAVGSLGAAAVLSVLLQPVVGPTFADSPSAGSVMAASYPLSDFFLLAATAGIATVLGKRASRHLGLLALGLLAFAVTDAAYAMQRSASTFEIGTPLDSGWAVGLALLAMSVEAAARAPAHAVRVDADASIRITALAVPSAATLAALAVLVLGTWHDVPRVSVVLAAVTLVAATARTHLAFGQVARVAVRRRHDAATDHLTGLANRRALAAEALVLLTEEHPAAVSVLLLDLDNFKDVNDHFGHDVGDALLVEVGIRIRTHLRGSDLLARLGGDEFAVVLVDCDRIRATAKARSIELTLAEPYAISGVHLRTSASVGIAVYPEDGPDLGALLRTADTAMYVEKAASGSVTAQPR